MRSQSRYNQIQEGWIPNSWTSLLSTRFTKTTLFQFYSTTFFLFRLLFDWLSSSLLCTPTIFMDHKLGSQLGTTLTFETNLNRSVPYCPSCVSVRVGVKPSTTDRHCRLRLKDTGNRPNGTGQLDGFRTKRPSKADRSCLSLPTEAHFPYLIPEY